MAIHKLFSKILLIQTYHTTCVSFSCQFISPRGGGGEGIQGKLERKKVTKLTTSENQIEHLDTGREIRYFAESS